MNTLRLAALTLAPLVASLAACASDKDQPETCDEYFNTLEDDAPRFDGLVTLAKSHDADLKWLAYCVAESKEHSKEYLSLPQALHDNNQSGLAKGDSIYVTSFTAVAIDPLTLLIDPYDVRFASAPDGMGKFPFGTAIANGDNAWAKIDLRGTPFITLPEFFDVTGNAAIRFGHYGQIAELVADGDGSATPRGGKIRVTFSGNNLDVEPADIAAAEIGIDLQEVVEG